MKLATYTAQGLTRTGIVVGDRIIDTGVTGTMIDLIRQWDAIKLPKESEVIFKGGSGGVRRGADVVKAIALGARAVFIGRPYLYGLASAGEAPAGALAKG